MKIGDKMISKIMNYAITPVLINFIKILLIMHFDYFELHNPQNSTFFVLVDTFFLDIHWFVPTVRVPSIKK